MSIEELEAEMLRLDPKGRARLAGRLLESLDDLTPEESTQIWVEEAERRAAAVEAGRLSARPAAAVFQDARARV
jgi:putative addiction module component (TIGR02574 family)